MTIVEAVLAALANPSVDAEILKAAAPLIDWIKSLPDQRRQTAIDALNNLATANMVQIADADADLAEMHAQLTALHAEHVAKVQGVLDALKVQILARVAPSPAK